MQNRICFILSLTLVSYWCNASPVGLGSLEFDNLDTPISDLSYEVEEEDLDDFSKLLDDANETVKSKTDKTNVKTSGFKKKNTANKGLKSDHDLKDLKRFFKTAAVHDQGDFDDDETYALAEGIAAGAVAVKGNENRKYKKGTKTRGFHRVHHKDEYKKDKVFYEDDETKGTLNKVGAKGSGYRFGGGVGFDKGHFHHDRHKGVYGKEGLSDKGYLNKKYNGYSDSQGFDASFNSDS